MSRNSFCFGFFQKMDGDVRHLLLRHRLLFAPIGTEVCCRGHVIDTVFRILSREQAVVYRQEGVPIRPPQCEHPKPEGVNMVGVVIELCQQLYLFRPGTAENRIIENQYILPFFYLLMVQ